MERESAINASVFIEGAMLWGFRFHAPQTSGAGHCKPSASHRCEHDGAHALPHHHHGPGEAHQPAASSRAAILSTSVSIAVSMARAVWSPLWLVMTNMPRSYFGMM